MLTYKKGDRVKVFSKSIGCSLDKMIIHRTPYLLSLYGRNGTIMAVHSKNSEWEESYTIQLDLTSEESYYVKFSVGALFKESDIIGINECSLEEELFEI